MAPNVRSNLSSSKMRRPNLEIMSIIDRSLVDQWTVSNALRIPSVCEPGALATHGKHVLWRGLCRKCAIANQFDSSHIEIPIWEPWCDSFQKDRCSDLSIGWCAVQPYASPTRSSQNLYFVTCSQLPPPLKSSDRAAPRRPANIRNNRGRPNRPWWPKSLRSDDYWNIVRQECSSHLGTFSSNLART